MVTTLGLWLITAHLVADFPLQPDWMAQQKTTDTGVRIQHVSVHLLVTTPVIYSVYGLTPVASVAVAWLWVSHFVIDSRRWVSPKDGWGNDGMMWVWLCDQIFHLIALSLIPVVAGLATPLT